MSLSGSVIDDFLLSSKNYILRLYASQIKITYNKINIDWAPSLHAMPQARNNTENAPWHIRSFLRAVAYAILESQVSSEASEKTTVKAKASVLLISWAY